MFGSITRIATNQRGDILVSEQNPYMVHAFGEDGNYLGRVDQIGQGPGEYRFISGLSTGSADSVYIWEFLLNQILIYDPVDFSYVRSVMVEEEGAKQIQLLIGAIEDGWYMTTGLPSFLKTDTDAMKINEDKQLELIKVARDGRYSKDPIETIPAGESILNIQENGGLNLLRMPFGRFPVFSLGDDDQLYYGWNEEVVIVSINGSDRDTVSTIHDPVLVTDTEMAAALESDDQLFRELLASNAYHTTKPAYQTFVVDDKRRIWAKLSTSENVSETEWLILDQASNIVGRTRLPDEVDLKVIRNDLVYGVFQERGGAPMVIVYRITE